MHPAYAAAIDRNIRLNANKTRRARWMEMAGAERANHFLFEIGEFEASRSIPHPVVKASLGDFWHSMRDQVALYGGLTTNQHFAVLSMIERAEKRVAAWEAKAKDGNWIGTVGERRMFTVSIKHIVRIEGQYGMSYLHIMKDDEDNSVIYKGTKCLGEIGERVTVKATVKEHGEREGVKQTKIARPA